MAERQKRKESVKGIFLKKAKKALAFFHNVCYYI